MNNADKDILKRQLVGFVDRFPGEIQDVQRREIAVPLRIDINLAIPITNQSYEIAGNFLYVIEAPAGTYIDIKFNNTDQASFDFYRQMGVETPFSKFYVTTPAGQAGTLTLQLATEAPRLFKIIDNRAAVSGDIEAVRDELRGDLLPENDGPEITVGNAAAVQILAANVDRKGCMIQSKAVNAGLVYISFANTVMPNNWVAELQGGMSITFDDYRGALFARASAVAQLVGWGEW